ncbi:MASE1 domain-containing protein, partial [Candidatus Nomurabacteria bacterium]|nr:MASE1 domain-containing protein [Candidatus Nomurabacteria bacterium]
MAQHISTRTYFLRLAVVAAAYALAAYLGLSLIPTEGSGASLVWPSAAIGIAALYFWGPGMWPAVTLSFFALLLSRDTLPPFAAAAALANTLESLTVVYVLRNIGFSPLLSRLRDSVGLMLSAFIGSFISATVIATAVLLFGDSAMPFNTALWAGIWVGHTVSILTFAPFALRWLARPLFTKTKAELVEGALVFGTLATLTYLIYWTPYGSVGNISLIYIAVLFYIWASLRTGPRGIALALALTGAIAATGVFFGYGPISQATNLASALFSIQVLIGTLSVIFLLFTSITEERKEAVIKLEHHVGQLESALERIRSEDQAKSDFIAILAHELRNPLSPILSGLEILKSQHAGPQDVVRMMGAHVHTIARLL